MPNNAATIAAVAASFLQLIGFLANVNFRQSRSGWKRKLEKS